MRMTPWLILAALMCAFTPLLADDLATAFVSPPEDTRPRCYWYWQDGHITTNGITKDLESMARVGIGGAYVGIIGGGAFKCLSEPWWQMVDHAIAEGGRTKVNVGLFNCPGWSQSGGPWVKPSQSMRYLVLPEMRLKGPQRFQGKLPLPAGKEGEFQPVALLAFPEPADGGVVLGRTVAATTTSTPEAKNLKAFFDGDPKTGPVIEKSEGAFALTFTAASPFTARSLTVTPAGAYYGRVQLDVDDGGQGWKNVGSLMVERANLDLNDGPVPLAPAGVNFAPVTGIRFRLSFDRFNGEVAVGEVALQAATTVENVAEKQLQKIGGGAQPPSGHAIWQAPKPLDKAAQAVKPASVIELTSKIASDGTLTWEVPAGVWVLQYVGMLPTGKTNVPAPPEGTGPEVDKMNASAVRDHFNAYMGVALARRKTPQARQALRYTIADSYEVGPQNWTDDMRGDFRKTYGYDPLPYLPVLSGRVVGSAEASDRFLWDLRRRVADRVAYDYVGTLRQESRKNGLTLWLEPYAHYGFPAEFLQYGGQSDEVAGEFWCGGQPGSGLGVYEVRCAASVAHTYGKPKVFCEAFTGGPAQRSTPQSLKGYTDWAYTEGINQFVLHLYYHQADTDGQGVNGWGTSFHRNNIWFEQMGTWIDYQRRCSVLLQQGHSVADTLYFIGEDVPKPMNAYREPAPPPGVDYDFINAEVILSRLSVKNGRWTLPGGQSYAVMALPPVETMRPAVLKMFDGLVRQGGVLLGKPPLRSPSLQGYPQADQELARLAEGLWGAGDAKPVRSVGKGKVLRGLTMAEALKEAGLSADVADLPEGIRFAHRRNNEVEIYFFSNQKPEAITFAPLLRVSGKLPERWDAGTGNRERLALYQEEKGGTRVPLSLAPFGSAFVVLRQPARGNHPVAIAAPAGLAQRSWVESGPLSVLAGDANKLEARARANGDYTLNWASGTKSTLRVSGVPEPRQLAGPWQVTFAPGNAKARAEQQPGTPVTFEKLGSLTERENENEKCFSGMATYRIAFRQEVSKPTTRWELDLGAAGSIAEVVLNGKTIATLWKPPFRADVTGALIPGENKLEVRVVNAWHNAMQRGRPTKEVEPLDPAGLIGPVRLEAVETLPLPVP
ncbi:MAG: glycosyl hydrolase [bacterium]